MRAFSAERPRWGYRRAHDQLIAEGWCVNRKRVQRLWREEGLRVRAAPAQAAQGSATRPASRPSCAPMRPGEIWAIDFQADQTAEGRALRLANVVDEFTREALAMHVARSVSADDLVDLLDGLAAEHGAPAFVRCDNGPELTATPCATGVGSPAPRPRSSNPARPGRTRSWSPSTPACATSCSTASCSAARPKPGS